MRGVYYASPFYCGKTDLKFWAEIKCWYTGTGTGTPGIELRPILSKEYRRTDW